VCVCVFCFTLWFQCSLLTWLCRKRQIRLNTGRHLCCDRNKLTSRPLRNTKSQRALGEYTYFSAVRFPVTTYHTLYQWSVEVMSVQWWDVIGHCMWQVQKVWNKCSKYGSIKYLLDVISFGSCTFASVRIIIWSQNGQPCTRHWLLLTDLM